MEKVSKDCVPTKESGMRTDKATVSTMLAGLCTSLNVYSNHRRRKDSSAVKTVHPSRLQNATSLAEHFLLIEADDRLFWKGGLKTRVDHGIRFCVFVCLA